MGHPPLRMKKALRNPQRALFRSIPNLLAAAGNQKQRNHPARAQEDQGSRLGNNRNRRSCKSGNRCARDERQGRDKNIA